MYFLAPPHERKRGWFVRFLQTLGIGTVTTLTLVAVTGLFFAKHFFFATPPQLYEYAWQTVPEMIYDPAEVKNWDSWRHKYDGKLATDEDAIKAANEMIGSIDDPYTRLHSPAEVAAMMQEAQGEFAGVGIRFEMRVDDQGKTVLDSRKVPIVASSDDGYPLVYEAMRGGPAIKGGIKDGDVLITVDTTDLKDIAIDKLVDLLKGPAGTTVDVVVRRDGAELKITLTRGIIEVDTVTVKRYGEIGYIGLSAFEQNDTMDEMKAGFEELKDSKALILDLRNNGGGRIDFALRIAALFMEQGDIVSVRSRIPAGGYHTTTSSVTSTNFVVTEEAGGRRFVQNLDRDPNLSGSRPLVILVNGNSASASEILAGALKDNHRGVLVGGKTYGKGIGQTVIPFVNGTMLRVTSLRYYNPSGHWPGDAHKNRIGIEPDHVVPEGPRFRALKASDNQLQFAIDLLEKKLSGSN